MIEDVSNAEMPIKLSECAVQGIHKVPEYGQCPNTDTLGISETINPTKKC